MEGSPSWVKSLFVMRQTNLSTMILSSLETYQHVVVEIAKEFVKTRKLSDKEFITLDDLCTREFNEAFYIGMNEIQNAEEYLNRYLLCAQDLDIDQVHGAMVDNLTFFCELDEVDNYLIRVLKRLEQRMKDNLLLDVEGCPIDLDYGLHPLDARELRGIGLGKNDGNDFKLFTAFIKSIELGNKIHGLDIMYEVTSQSEYFDGLGNRVEFDCDTMEIANTLLRKEVKNGMSL